MATRVLTPEQRARRREKEKQLREANPTTYRNTMKAWQANNPELFRLYQLRSRAKKKGVPFDLTVEDMTHPTHCPILGIELDNNSESFELKPTLDRLIPERGYVRSNVQWISSRANRIKSDATPEEIESVATWIRAQLAAMPQP